MSEWKEYKLGDLISINAKSIDRNYPYRQIDYLDTGSITRGKIESFQSIDLQHAPSRAKRLVQDNDIIYSTVRPIQRHYGIIKNPKPNLVISTGFAVLSCDERQADSNFIYYFLTSDEIVNYLDMVAEGSTSAYPSLTLDVIADIDILLPPLPEQKSIASVLSSLDDKIDLLHRQNKTLEALAETLFRQWFVRRPELIEGEEAEEGRETGKLGDYAAVTTGKGLKRNEFIDDGIYPVLGANGEIGRTNNFLTDDRLILTGRVGTLGRVYISEDKVWISDNVLIVKPESLFFYPIYFILKRTEFENLNVGSTQPLVTQTDLKNIEFKLPSADILESYEKQCSIYFEKIKQNLIQIRTLTRLRDTLLPKLMSGKVRVKEKDNKTE
jgi:type I restriction enzyme S subunit